MNIGNSQTCNCATHNKEDALKACDRGILQFTDEGKESYTITLF